MKNETRLIAPSILSADFARLAEGIAVVEKGGADWIHVDVMDGHFVPNLTIGPAVVAALRPCTKLPLDVHLMIENPERLIDAFAKAGSDWITVHIEACPDFPDLIKRIRGAGKKVGVSVKPKTSVDTIRPYLSQVDLVLVMTVEPGFGGQAFMADMMPKVQALAALKKSEGHKFLIEVDGGIGPDTIGVASQAGAEVFVAGNSIYKTPDPAQAVRTLRNSLR